MYLQNQLTHNSAPILLHKLPSKILILTVYRNDYADTAAFTKVKRGLRNNKTLLLLILLWVVTAAANCFLDILKVNIIKEYVISMNMAHTTPNTIVIY